MREKVDRNVANDDVGMYITQQGATGNPQATKDALRVNNANCDRLGKWKRMWCNVTVIAEIDSGVGHRESRYRAKSKDGAETVSVRAWINRKKERATRQSAHAR
jgi:hypothetical protein